MPTQERWDATKQDLVNASRNAGVDPGLMAKITGLESDYNPTGRPISRIAALNHTTQFDGVKAMSSAYGLGQIENGTWANLINHYGAK